MSPAEDPTSAIYAPSVDATEKAFTSACPRESGGIIGLGKGKAGSPVTHTREYGKGYHESRGVASLTSPANADNHTAFLGVRSSGSPAIGTPTIGHWYYMSLPLRSNRQFLNYLDKPLICAQPLTQLNRPKNFT